MSRERVNILGVRVHNCDEREAVAAVEGFLRERPERLHQVCTVNPEFVMEARRNEAFRELLNRVDLATPDGAGILIAGPLLDKRVKGRATGVQLVEHLAKISAQDGYSLFLLGAEHGVAAQAAEELKRRHGDVRIAGTFAGTPEDEDWPEISSRLEQANPDVLLVAYGAPRQDLWIDKHRHKLPSSVKVAIGVGGVYDYLSGKVPLAPPILRRLWLEWFYRWIKQPWRWPRIRQVFVFGWLVLVEAIWRRVTRNTSQENV
ncbi:MAG TPA: WecB/TagA/CpsF family glycosyltransferase [Chloroflexia bacterium]|nr:WecB/TagA/CpsF family glycosyltransferase [Chloroflexia bacterium]